MLHKQLSKPAGKALAAGLMAAWLSTGAIASGPEKSNDNAAQAQPATAPAVQQELTHAQIARMAQQYSIDNKAVGIYVNVAPDTNMTPQQIGDGLVRKFAELGIPAAYAYSYAKEGRTGIDYFIQGHPYAGYGLGVIQEGFDLVASTFKALESQQNNAVTSAEVALAR